MWQDYYKNYCIWPYNKWDVIEVLIADDIDDWYSFDPSTEYYYVRWPYICLVWKYDWNTTGDIVNLKVHKNYDTRECFGDIIKQCSFDSTHIVEHRKIEIENHIWYKPRTKQRDKLEFRLWT